MLRLKSRAQFQAVLAGHTVAKTTHFALHQLDLTAVVPSLTDADLAIDIATPPSAVPDRPDVMALRTPVGPTVAERPGVSLVKTTAKPLFPDTSTAWLGAMIPKRWAKRAVTRNAIKRQVYAMTAAHTPPLPCAAYVLRLRAGFDRKQYVSASSEQLRQAVRTELQILLERAGDAPHPAFGRGGLGSRSRGRSGASA